MLEGLGKIYGGVTCRFSNRPNCTRVDAVDIFQGQDAPQKCGDHHEDARTKEHTNG